MTILHPNGVYRIRLRNCLCVYFGPNQQQSDDDRLLYDFAFINLEAKREVDCTIVAEVVCYFDQKTAHFVYEGDHKIEFTAPTPAAFFNKAH